MKGWAREVAQHHAREGPSRIASCAASRTASCATSGAASCAPSCLRSIMRNITRSFTRSSVKTQRSTQEKLTGEFFRSAAPSLLITCSRRKDIAVFTLVSHLQCQRCQSIFNIFLCFWAPVVKLNPILFGVACRDSCSRILIQLEASSRGEYPIISVTFVLAMFLLGYCFLGHPRCRHGRPC